MTNAPQKLHQLQHRFSILSVFCRNTVADFEGLQITSATYTSGTVPLTGQNKDVKVLTSRKSLEAQLCSQHYDHVIALQDHAGWPQMLVHPSYCASPLSSINQSLSHLIASSAYACFFEPEKRLQVLCDSPYNDQINATFCNQKAVVQSKVIYTFSGGETLQKDLAASSMLWLLREVLRLKKTKVSLLTVGLLNRETSSAAASLYSAVGESILLPYLHAFLNAFGILSH